MLLKTFEVKKEWVDYNNHMNMAYYVLVFDQAWEVALEKFKMGGTAAKDLNRSTMVVETNTKYLNEVKEGEKVNINVSYFDHDKKRLHLKMEMISQKTNNLSASMEWISLYIDLSKRKVTEFEEDKIKLMRDFIEENKSKFSKSLGFRFPPWHSKARTKKYIWLDGQIISPNFTPPEFIYLSNQNQNFQNLFDRLLTFKYKLVE